MQNISDGELLFNSSVQTRKEWLIHFSSSPHFVPPPDLPLYLQETYRVSRALEAVLPRYFELRIQRDMQKFEQYELRTSLIREQVNVFLPVALSDLKLGYHALLRDARDKPKNLYELGGALRLAFGSNATRSISTKLGLVWERIACLSPYAINPESEFGIKIEGVDAIISRGQELVFAQIKTQKNTLTGSQKGRSIQELTLHKNRLMVACFDTNTNWTFSSDAVPRVCGEQFWNLIGFPYHEILSELKRLMPLLDEEFGGLFVNNEKSD